MLHDNDNDNDHDHDQRHDRDRDNDNDNDSNNDNDNDTLVEDGPNMCWTPGCVGMSDGVMTSRKNIGNLIRC